jgi:hypothetical protein
MSKSFCCLFIFALIISSCTKNQSSQFNSDFTIKYIDKVSIPNDQLIDSTLIGGLSSIDYLEGDKFVVISDDRSEFSPARIYEVQIEFDSSGITDYIFNKTTLLKNKDSLSFKQNEMDPESIRYRKSTDTYFYTSEGGRTEDWIDPFIWEINRSGEFISEVEVPDIFQFSDETGLRVNGGFESLSFENDTIIWYANELPLKEDGEVASFETGDFPVRLVRHDIKNNNILNQYAYKISHLNEKPIPEDGFFINSVPEILFIDDNRLWVMERSYTKGIGNFVKVFEINLNNATDVKKIKALTEADYKAVSKNMILDFSDYNHKIDNIEGMTFGPDFPDGSKSLIFISDDNFNKEQETQLWLFSVKGLN